jgi:hypothetical protein
MIKICNQLPRHDLAMVSEEIRLYLRDVHDHVLFVDNFIACASGSPPRSKLAGFWHPRVKTKL